MDMQIGQPEKLTYRPAQDLDDSVPDGVVPSDETFFHAHIIA